MRKRKKIIIIVSSTLLVLLIAAMLFLNWAMTNFEIYSAAKVTKEFSEAGFPEPREAFFPATIPSGDSSSEASASSGKETEFLLHYYSTESLVENPQKPILYLLHGAPGGAVNFFESSYFFNKQLRERFVLIAVDRPGYGQSLRSEAIPEFSRAIAPLLQQLSSLRQAYPKRKVYGLGWSFGGPLLALIAARVSREPKLLVDGKRILDGAIIVASPADPEQEKFWWFNPILEWPFLHWMFASSVNVANVEKMAHPAELQKMLGAWSQIQIPAAYLQGTDDGIVYPQNIEFLRQQIQDPNGKIYEIQGGGHGIVFSEINLIQDILEQWLRG